MDTACFECMKGVLEASPEVKTANYFTDAPALSPTYEKPPTIILEPDDACMVNKTDEYCEIENLHPSVEIYKAIIR